MGDDDGLGREQSDIDYLTGLRNAHALENEALQIMGRQVERLSKYPEMEARLRQHIDETKGQQERVAAIMETHGTDSSTIKDAVQALMGNVAALGHSMAVDDILKNSFANYAFGSFEVASYTSLIAMAGQVGDQAAVSALDQSLRQEIAMQEWLADQMTAFDRAHEACTASRKVGSLCHVISYGCRREGGAAARSRIVGRALDWSREASGLLPRICATAAELEPAVLTACSSALRLTPNFSVQVANLIILRPVDA